MSGPNSLITVDDEPPGANCANGGVRVRVGLDDNRNATLDPAEIDSTSYVCTGPLRRCTIAASAYPATVADRIGTLAFGPGCDVLFAPFVSRPVQRIASDGTVSEFAPALNGLLSIHYDLATDTVYYNQGANIRAVRAGSAQSSPVATTAQDAVTMHIAPPGFGNYGGQLVVAGIGGTLYAVELTTGTTTPIGSPVPLINALDFAQDGTLYGSDATGDTVLRISPTGDSTVVANVAGPSSIQVDDANNRLLVVAEGTDQILGVDRTSGAVTILENNVGSLGGWAPHGILFDGTRLIGLRGPDQLVLFDLVP